MDDATPPTEHILRPHHVALLTVFAAAFQDNLHKGFPAPYTLHLYRLLLNEVSEVTTPKSHRELMTDLRVGPKSESKECRAFIDNVYLMQAKLDTADKLIDFFRDQTSLFLEKSEEEPAVFARRSIFGYFCRRCFVSFLKLSFAGVMKLQAKYQAWVNGDVTAGYDSIEKDSLANANVLIFRTQADKKSWAKADSYELFERGLATGDETVASENLRRFFEQHFHENSDSGLRQHALLNLVRMHYIRGEFSAARQLLTEAVTVSRTSGDRFTLQHCISLLHRLPSSVPSAKPVLNEIQPDLHPLEILFDVKKLLDEQNDQPVYAAFIRIAQALGLYDHWLDTQLMIPVEEEQWAQHAAQSIVWRVAGCARLSDIEENIVLAFMDVTSEHSTRITVVLNKAYQKSRKGDYEAALAMLLDPSVWQELSLHDYVFWADEIWNILCLRANRRGQERLYRTLLLPHRPHVPCNSDQWNTNGDVKSREKLRATLAEVLSMRKYHQSVVAIEHLLRGLWHSEFLGHLNKYRTSIILLADIGLEFGMSRRCKRILEDIMPQVINGDDLEQRAVACFTFARCILVSEESSRKSQEDALPYLLVAEKDFSSLEMHSALEDVLYMKSVLYHNLGMESQRDEAASRHAEVQNYRKKVEECVVDQEVQRILTLVSAVGADVASRR
ncbi:hypothetical protein BDQ17DRAFT_1353475 [Cyathus striatus]|nr:hypothetical protein BDQ17DRAFT_1353475 [Cyathus striatus]